MWTGTTVGSPFGAAKALSDTELCLPCFYRSTLSRELRGNQILPEELSMGEFLNEAPLSAWAVQRCVQRYDDRRLWELIKAFNLSILRQRPIDQNASALLSEAVIQYTLRRMNSEELTGFCEHLYSLSSCQE